MCTWDVRKQADVHVSKFSQHEEVLGVKRCGLIVDGLFQCGLPFYTNATRSTHTHAAGEVCTGETLRPCRVQYL